MRSLILRIEWMFVFVPPLILLKAKNMEQIVFDCNGLQKERVYGFHTHKKKEMQSRNTTNQDGH